MTLNTTIVESRTLEEGETSHVHHCMETELGFHFYCVIGVTGEASGNRAKALVKHNMPVDILAPLIFELIKTTPGLADAFDDHAFAEAAMADPDIGQTC